MKEGPEESNRDAKEQTGGERKREGIYKNSEILFSSVPLLLMQSIEFTTEALQAVLGR